jgi:Protein of unknown function (DUF2023)
MRLQKRGTSLPVQRKKVMNVFYHHVYEYKKGIRRLILHTTLKSHRSQIEETLQKKEINYLIFRVGKNKINVFFGDSVCINVIQNFLKQNLYDLTDEEDFILGIMLGYDTAMQCRRYLKRKDQANIKHVQELAA